MSNVDPRLELARQIAANRRMPSIAPMAPTGGGPVARKTLSADVRAVQSQVQDATTELLGRFPSLSEQVEAIAKNKPMGGVKGALVGALSSTPGKILIKPLEVLDIGRRGVISGARELVDALDSDPKTRASVKDFADQVKDPTFGFGRAFPVKGKWGYVTGFVGDVLLDPLTYATLGTSQVAGLAARTAMATKYLDRFGDAAKAAQIVQRGKTVMNASEIAELGLKRSGVYFFGERLRVPLSGPLGEAMLSGVTRARIGVTNTRFGKTLQKGFMGMGANGSQALRDLRLALARGERLPNDISAEAGLRLIASEDIRRSVAAEALRTAQIRMAQELDNVGDDQINAYGKIAYKWLDGTATPQNATEQAFADRFKGLFQELWDNVNEDFKQLVPDEDLAKVTEYFPWVMTREARDLTTDLQTPWVKGLMTYLEPNMLDRTGSFRSRNLAVGNEFLWTLDDDGKKIPYLLKQEDLNIERLNEISRGALGVDFFETDLRTVLQNYSGSFSRQKGLLAMYKELQDKGVIQALTERNVVDEDMANAFVESVNATVNAAMSTLDSASVRLREAVKVITDDARSRVKGAPKVVSAADEALRAATAAAEPAAEAAAINRVNVAKEAVAAVREEISGMQQRLGALFAGEVPDELTPVIDNYERIKTLMSQMENEIASREAAIQRLVADDVGDASMGIEEELASLKTAVDKAEETIKDATNRHRLFMAMNDIISGRYDDIVNGVTPRDADLSRTVKILRGDNRLPKRGDAPTSVENFAKTPGTYQSWAKRKDTRLTVEDWFQTVAGFVKPTRFNVAGVANMTYDRALGLATNAAPSMDNAYDLLTAAGFFLARDLKFYGSQGNAALDVARQKLVDSLKKAAGLMALKDGEKAALSNKSFRQLLNQTEDLTQVVSQLQVYRNVMDMLRKAIDETVATGSVPQWLFAERSIAQSMFSPEDIYNSSMVSEFVPDIDSAADFVRKAEDAIAMLESKPVTSVDMGYESRWVPPKRTVKRRVEKDGKVFFVSEETDVWTVKDLDATAKKVDENRAKIDRQLSSPQINLTKEFKADPKKMAELERGFAPAMRELSDNILAYGLASEVERRFSALGMEFATYGLVPTRDMYNTVIRVVGNDFYGVTSARTSAVNRTVEALTNLRERVLSTMANKGDWVDEFNKGIADIYGGDDKDAILAVLGPDSALANGARQLRARRKTELSTASEPYYQAASELLSDPYIRAAAVEMGMTPQWLKNHSEKVAYRSFLKNIMTQIEDDVFDFGDASQAKISLTKEKVAKVRELDALRKDAVEEYDEALKEWFAKSFPNKKFSWDAVDRELGAMPTKSQAAMRIWFTELLGGYYKHGATESARSTSTRFSTKGGKNAALTKRTAEVEFVAEVIEGSLRNEQSLLNARTSSLINLVDKSSDPVDFLNDPFGVQGGPLSYEASLKNVAERIKQEMSVVTPAVVKRVDKAFSGYKTAKARVAYLEEFIDRRVAIQGEDVLDILGLKTDDTISAELRRLPGEDFGAYRKRVGEETYQQYRQRIIDSLSDNQGIEFLTSDKGFRKVLEMDELLTQTTGMRNVRTKIKNLKNSEEYLMAVHEREFYEFLTELSGYDGSRMVNAANGQSGWYFDDPRTVGPGGKKGAVDAIKARSARFATFRSPETQQRRAEILGRLFQQNKIDEATYRDLLWFAGSNRSIDSIPVELQTRIGPDYMAILRDTDEILTFTPQEWASLFDAPSASTLSRVANRQGQIKKEIASLQDLINKGQATKTIRDAKGKPQRIDIARRIRQLNEEFTNNGFVLESGRADTRALAMRKARALFEQMGENADLSIKSSRAKENFNRLRGYHADRAKIVDRSLVRKRKAFLKAQWESSKDYSVIQKLNVLENSEDYNNFAQAIAGLRGFRSALTDAQLVLDDVIGPGSTYRAASDSITDLLDRTTRDIDAAVAQGGPEVFSPEGLQLLDAVKAHVSELLSGSPELGGRLDIPSLRATLPKEIVEAAKVIGATARSPIESKFVQSISGVNPLKEVVEAHWDLMLLKGRQSILMQGHKTIEDEIAALTASIGPEAVKRIPKSVPDDLGVRLNPLPPGYMWVKSPRGGYTRAPIQAVYEKASKDLNDAIGKWHKATQKEVESIVKRLELKSGKLAEATIELDYAQSALDNIIPNLADAESTMEYVKDFVVPRIQRLEELLERISKTKSGKKTVFANPENYRDILDVVEDFRVVYNDLLSDPNDPVFKALADVVNVNAQYMNVLNNVTYMRNIQAATLSDASFTRVEKLINEGFAALEIATAGNPELRWAQAPKEVVEFFENSRRLKDPQFARGVMRFAQNYTQFFKSYATLSPGFHVRNAMSNTFALVAAGGDVRNFSKGLKLYRSLREAMDRNMSVDQWVATLPQADREVARIAARSMFASGGGQVSEAFVGQARRGPGVRGKIQENAVLRASRNVGGNLESSSRFILGYDSAMKGMDFQTSAARVRRHMVDYEDVGVADEYLRTIIPFWMWTSRALPMHLANQWLNPRPYAIYESFKRNTRRDDENEIVPSWVTEQGGFRIASKTYLMPDLGFNRIGQQVAELGDPARLMSQANPLVRLPYELMGDRKLYTGQPFRGEPQEVEGGVAALLQPLLQIAGYGETGPDGKKFVDEKALYAVQNLIPFLAQGERLLPSTESGQERQGQAVLGYLGAPVRRITETQQRGELLRQLNELRQLQARQESMYGG